MTTVTELKCPYCGKTLTSTEYEHAIYEFKKGAEDEYNEQRRKDIEDFEKKKQQLIENHKREIENQYQIVEEIKTCYKQQIEDLKNSYDELAKQKQMDFDKLLDQRLAPYEEELYEKDIQIQELQNKQEEFKAQVSEQARVTVQKEIDERDIQIGRYKEKVEELRKQLSETQSERKGEVGEEHLLRILKDEFQNEGDLFVREKRGSSGADIIQQIRGTSGKLLDTTIGYDNKEGADIKLGDIEKAKKDKESLGTEYFIIVSQNLPKNIAKDGNYGEKDGIIFVTLKTIVAVARTIRKGLIDISKKSASTSDEESKQRKMYDYIRGRDFCRQVESICGTHEEMCKLQDKEEKDHKTLWKKREALQKQLRKTYIDISSGIESIIEEQPNDDKKDPTYATNGDGKDKGHLQNNPKDAEHHEQ